MGRCRPRALRIYLETISRVDRNGHAHYGPDELALLLCADPTSGEVRAVTKSSAANGVKIA